MSIYTDPKNGAEARVTCAAFRVGECQRDLEDAMAEFRAALDAVEWLKKRDLENTPDHSGSDRRE